MVVWEILSRQIPWAEQALPRDIYLRVVMRGERPAIPADTPADIAQMLHGCWAQEPEERPTFQALIMELCRDSPADGASSNEFLSSSQLVRRTVE